MGCPSIARSYLLYVELLQRDDRDGVLDGSARQRVASVQEHIALRGILEGKVTATFQIDMVGLVGT